MIVKKTIAFIGDVSKTCPVFIKKLTQENLRLLFVCSDEEEIKKIAAQEGLSAEIELIDCVKDGCWEADIITFVDPENTDEQLVQRIKDVATQKFVLSIFTGMEDKNNKSVPGTESLQELLPHSMVVGVRLFSEDSKAFISGKHQEPIRTVSVIFENAGYLTALIKIGE